MATDPRTLQLGQRVALTDMTFGFQLTTPEDGQVALTVAEVGADFVALEDAADGTRRRIPLYLLHHKPTSPPPPVVHETPVAEEVRPAA